MIGIGDAETADIVPPDPGTFPFTRGIRADGYQTKPWTMRQYAGFGTAEETNARFHQLIDSGQTGLSMAFDLPTQMGYDSDHPMAHGEVGKVGVAIDSIEDLGAAFADLPLETVTTSMTINAPAAVLLSMYEVSAKRRGIPASKLGGTIQNDILKEFVSRGTYIFPPEQSLRLVVDSFAYCMEELPRWNPISVSGYHMREAGATAAQEIAFTLANAVCYVDAAREAGLDLGRIIPRITFFFNVSSDFLEEVAKFRAARGIWAHIVRDRYGLSDPRAQYFRCHAQTSGAALTAQQPLNNISRVTMQALAAVFGGVQSLHANGYDEALALPTRQAAEIALRTQQIIANETGVTAFPDPLGGSFVLEKLTRSLEEDAQALMDEVEEHGGAIQAIEAGVYQRYISDAAYEYQRRIDHGECKIVGVNSVKETVQEPVEILRISASVEVEQRDKLARFKATRDAANVQSALAALQEGATGCLNLMYLMKAAVEVGATVGEICDALRIVFGPYEPPLVV